MSAINQRLKKVESSLSQKELLNFAHDFFVKATPIDSGNARKRTKKEGSDTIFADYAYAKRLDQGWSKQAPDGMSKPLFAELTKHIKGI
jgi:hypothetical protein